jgi:diguanylate cyclase (GGDEF)-like protein
MKRGCRVDDLARIDGAGAAAPAAELRSMLLAPMIVSERVLGLVAVYGRRPGAYDDHGLSVLTTIAHQGAVAIESERHYRSATEDSLTGFYVRDYFFERLREEQGRASRYGGRFSLLMIDLDGFKKINDDHGHLAGDRYLRAVGDAIRSQLRGADIACRYGGDEFCVLLPQTDLAGARVIAERVRVAVGSTVASYGGKPLRTTASIGVAVWPADGGPSERDLVRHADEALYRAKREGRDRVVPFAA